MSFLVFMTLFKKGRLDEVDELLKKEGHTVNTIRESGRTLFIWACLHDRDIKLVQGLLSHPAIDVNQEDDFGMTPLYVACNYGDLDLFRLLLQRPEIDLNKGSGRYSSPLVRAVASGFCEGVRVLVSLPATAVRGYDELEALKEAHELRLSLLVELLLTRKDFVVSSDLPTRASQEIRDVVAQHQADPVATQRRLYEKHFPPKNPASLFATTVFLCDDYLSLPDEGSSSSEAARRFFKTMRRLPLELQMVLSNYVYGVASANIPCKQREEAFVYIAHKLLLPEEEIN